MKKLLLFLSACTSLLFGEVVDFKDLNEELIEEFNTARSEDLMVLMSRGDALSLFDISEDRLHLPGQFGRDLKALEPLYLRKSVHLEVTRDMESWETLSSFIANEEGVAFSYDFLPIELSLP